MSADSVIDPGLLNILRCPTLGLQLRVEGGDLVSTDGSRPYPVIAGIPCLMRDSRADPTGSTASFATKTESKDTHMLPKKMLSALFRR
jgi:uncharacterized protein YbaR (Trm112 family)